MGSLHAAEFANAVDEKQVSLVNALRYHLGANHFPPIPDIFIPIAVRAIEKGNEAEFDQDIWLEEIELPDGASYKGRTSAPVSAIINWMHLDFFLAPLDQYPEEEEEYGGV